MRLLTAENRGLLASIILLSEPFFSQLSASFGLWCFVGHPRNAALWKRYFFLECETGLEDFMFLTLASASSKMKWWWISLWICFEPQVGVLEGGVGRPAPRVLLQKEETVALCSFMNEGSVLKEFPTNFLGLCTMSSLSSSLWDGLLSLLFLGSVSSTISWELCFFSLLSSPASLKCLFCRPLGRLRTLCTLSSLLPWVLNLS